MSAPPENKKATAGIGMSEWVPDRTTAAMDVNKVIAGGQHTAPPTSQNVTSTCCVDILARFMPIVGKKLSSDAPLYCGTNARLICSSVVVFPLKSKPTISTFSSSFLVNHAYSPEIKLNMTGGARRAAPRGAGVPRGELCPSSSSRRQLGRRHVVGVET